MGAQKYDAQLPPEKAWLDLDEGERIRLVEIHHRELGEELPNLRLHAAVHVIVENQIALGAETPVAATVERLMREGLDRHDAVHAVGAVLSGELFHVLRGESQGEELSRAYYEKLGRITAKKWGRGEVL